MSTILVVASIVVVALIVGFLLGIWYAVKHLHVFLADMNASQLNNLAGNVIRERVGRK